MSSVSAPSGAPLAAAALPTPEEVRGWRKKDVTNWASKLGLDDDDVAKLVDQKIDGAALLEVTQADLERWRMPLAAPRARLCAPWPPLSAGAARARRQPTAAAQVRASLFVPSPCPPPPCVRVHPPFL
jgi:hypothetical protein